MASFSLRWIANATDIYSVQYYGNERVPQVGMGTFDIPSYSWFGLVVWLKLKIQTNHSISKVENPGYGRCYINNLTKNQGSAVFHSCVIWRSLSPKFTELCIEMPCLCPLEGHKHGGCKVTEASSIEFCYWNKTFSTLELWHIEIKTLFGASIV